MFRGELFECICGRWGTGAKPKKGTRELYYVRVVVVALRFVACLGAWVVASRPQWMLRLSVNAARAHTNCNAITIALQGHGKCHRGNLVQNHGQGVAPGQVVASRVMPWGVDVARGKTLAAHGEEPVLNTCTK